MAKRDAKLDDRRRKFVKEYQKDLNQAAASVRAGFSEKSKKSKGSKLMAEPAVRQAIEADLQVTLAKCGITAERIILEQKAIAFSSIKDLFDDDGRLYTPNKLKDETAAAVASFENGETLKIRLHDKQQALQQLAKYMALVKPDSAINLSVSLESLIAPTMGDPDGE